MFLKHLGSFFWKRFVVFSFEFENLAFSVILELDPWSSTLGTVRYYRAGMVQYSTVLVGPCPCTYP